MVGRAHWGCEDYCYGCKYRLSNVGLSNCHEYRQSIKVIFTQTIEEIRPGAFADSQINQSTLYISIGCSLGLISFLALVIGFAYHKTKESLKNKTVTFKKPQMSDVTDYLNKFRNKALELIYKNAGVRFLVWKVEKEVMGKLIQDLIQNIMILSNGIMAVIFAEKWNGDNNPLLIINNKFRKSFRFSDNNASDIRQIMETKHVDDFVDTLNFWIYLVNMVNGVIAFLIIVSWLCTKTGDRGTWIKIRLFNACSMLGSIFIVLGIKFLCNS